MSLAMYASPYDSPPALLSDEFEKNDKKIKKTSRPRTQKNHSEKVNNVLLSINDDNLADFVYEPENTEDTVLIEELKNNNNQHPASVANFHKNIVPSYNEIKPRYENFQNLSNKMEPDVLLDKINYIIGLLENQQDEKTHNIIEDLIIYALLGCFIIFIIDKFVSVGRYVR
jgi:hypothetical protein